MDPAFQVSVSCALAVLWLLGAAHKLRDFAVFRATLREYRLVPKAAVGAAAMGIVGLETALGIGLLAGVGRWTGLVGSAALLTLYAGAMGVNLVRGRRHIDCGCMARGLGQPLSEWLVARNLVLAAAALAASLPAGSRALLWVDVISIGAAVSVLVALYAAFDRLIANSRSLARPGD